MGTLLRENEDFKFTKRNEIRNAYLKIFPKHAAELRKIFDAPEIRWTAATRNAFVHKGGIADAEFNNMVGDCRALRVPKRRKNKRIHLDCELVHDLICGMAIQVDNLLTFVNGWMKNHPVKNVRERKKTKA